MLYKNLSEGEMTPENLLKIYEGDLERYHGDIQSFTLGSSTELTDASNEDSPSRNNMAANHMGQSLPTVKTGKRLFWNGPERAYGLHGMSDVKVPADADVLAVIPRYLNMNSLRIRSPYDLVIYCIDRPGKKSELGYFTTKEYGSHTLNFGFKLDFSHSASELKPGGVLSADFPVGRNTVSDENGDYQYAHECNILFASNNIVTEDQYWACKETLQEKFTFYLYNEMETNYRDQFVALDTYGKGDVYQPLPLPGQEIRKDGLLMGYREKSRVTPWVHLNKDALRTVNYDSDRLIHVESPMIGLGMCYDVEVTRGRTAKAQRVLGGSTDVLNQLADMHEDFYSRVLIAYNGLRRKYGYEAFSYSRDFCALIANAYILARNTEGCNLPEIKRIADKLMVLSAGVEQGDFNIRITCVGEKVPSTGDKATDTHGTKLMVAQGESPECEAYKLLVNS